MQWTLVNPTPFKLFYSHTVIHLRQETPLNTIRVKQSPLKKKKLVACSWDCLLWMIWSIYLALIQIVRKPEMA